MTPEEIKAIFDEKIAIIRQYWDKYWNISDKQKKKYFETFTDYSASERIPPLNPIYRNTVEYRDMIQVHSDITNKPIDLMRRRAPNEDDRQFAYRVRNFENITMPSFMKALSKLNRIFNKSNYSIQWTKEQTEEKDFFEDDIPVFGSIENYFSEIVLTQKILDPNSLCVVRPYFIPYKEDFDEAGNPVLIADDQQLITPYASVISCENVIDFKEGVYALILTQEKSEVIVGDKKKREGLVFEFYDDQNIYRITQVGEKNKWQFDYSVYYPHALGYLPCWKLKGVPQQKDLHVLYQSYFIYAIPNLNEALYLNSSLNMSLVTHMHPHLAEWVSPCPESGCDGGKIWRDQGNGLPQVEMNCTRCNGLGTVSSVGPMMTKQFKIADPDQGDSAINNVPFPGMAYVAPDVQAPIFVAKLIDSLIEDGFGFINIEVSNSDVKGSETALGKQIDREELFSMLMRISTETFGLMHEVMEAMGQMRYGEKFENPIISEPTSFSIRSEQDLLNELSEAKKAGVPDVALREILREYFAKRFSNQAHIEKIINLSFGVDRLITKDQIECDALLASGTASKREVILHDSIFTFIENIIIEDENFWDKSYQDQAAALWEKADEKMKEIDDSQSGNTADVLAIASRVDKKITSIGA